MTPSTAAIILSAAGRALSAWEAGDFQPITRDAARKMGFELETETAPHFEWDGDHASWTAFQHSEDGPSGLLEIHIADGHELVSFWLDPTTGAIERA